MSEAVNALSQVLMEKLQFQRIEIRCDERNLRSGRVAERCGFTLEGTLRADCRDVHGELRNTRIYSRIS
jgi:RimJ/RimL family protein N-acetyltransferase